MPFKTIPRIVKGNGSLDELTGKELMGFLMLDPKAASEIDKYKFRINAKIFKALLYVKLTKMRRAHGWRWKKKIDNKLDAEDKLLLRYYDYMAKTTFINPKVYFNEYHLRFKDHFNTSAEFKRDVIVAIATDEKEKKRMFKKYGISSDTQVGLW